MLIVLKKITGINQTALIFAKKMVTLGIQDTSKKHPRSVVSCFILPSLGETSCLDLPELAIDAIRRWNLADSEFFELKS
jgi:hypothetical protein